MSDSPSGAADTSVVDALRRDGLLNDRAAVGELTALGFKAIAAATSVVLDDPVVSSERAVSFVLHSPLELLARCALATRVEPDETATARLVSLANRYAARHPRHVVPPPVAGGLDVAVAAGDPDGAEAAVAALSADQLRVELAHVGVSRTAAAGHANIYLQLAATAGTAVPATMARGLVRDLALDPRALISVNANPADCNETIFDAFARIPNVGPPAERGIAALVDHVTSAASEAIATFASAACASGRERAAADLARLAASQMLLGDDTNVPYGWTHALTLTQGAFAAADAGANTNAAVTAAAAYTGAFWSAYGGAASVPATAVELNGPATSSDFAPLVAAASRSHDAHLVKYTLTCAQLAEADPEAGRLFLAATRRLHDWWAHNPPADDPLTLSP
jgi:hypothetical protein